MSRRDDIHEIARGRWRHILLAAGCPEKALSGKHTACPCCGGTDRYRWDNKAGSGSSICNACGSKSGVDLVMALRRVNFVEARKWILEQIGQAPVEVPRAPRNNARITEKLEVLWRSSRRLTGDDPASLYLRHRGIAPAEYPTQLRFHPRSAYRHETGKITHHPALVAKMVSADAKTWTIHQTFLDERGNKAEVKPARKLAPLSIPVGGAVRLASSAETMGIAEGIETSLSAMQLFGVPVWAALSAGAMTKWEPPKTAKNILIFGDADAGYAGQAAAYTLAHKLASKGLHVDVRLPPDIGSDWNDVVMAEQR